MRACKLEESFKSFFLAQKILRFYGWVSRSDDEKLGSYKIKVSFDQGRSERPNPRKFRTIGIKLCSFDKNLN
jgi:hypothetical protein